MPASFKLTITMGDPAGIGPEIALKAACGRKWPRNVHFVLVGCREVWMRCAAMINMPPPPECAAISRGNLPQVCTWEPSAYCAQHDIADWHPGRTGKLCGRMALNFIRAAVSLCLKHGYNGLVTGPICKSSIQAAGYAFPGHTEYLAHLPGAPRVAMMLIGGKLRVVLVTRHLPLSSVAKAITRRAVTETVEMTGLGLHWLQAPGKIIGVCALNPHAGDGGVLGKEEKTIIAPAIKSLRRKGLKVAGPVPADVIFHQAMRGRFGAVVAMYHDQGLGPLKMIAFESGVNLTLGLPFVRTSPDHGTAFDIAGRGIASPSSMIEAIRLAVRLAGRPNPWQG